MAEFWHRMILFQKVFAVVYPFVIVILFATGNVTSGIWAVTFYVLLLLHEAQRQMLEDALSLAAHLRKQLDLERMFRG